MGILDRFRRTETDPVREAAERYVALQDKLDEAGVTLTDLMLQLDMDGFDRLGHASDDFLDLEQPKRETQVKRSRLYWQREPLPDRIIALWTEYAFGRGWSMEPQDEGFRDTLDMLFAARHNRRQFSRQGWQRNSTALLVDGERWFGYWLSPSDRNASEIRVRTFDPLEIKEVLTNPDDKDEVWYYRRTYREGDTIRTRFYRDWDHVDASGRPRDDPHPRMSPSARDVSTFGRTDFQPEPNVAVSYLAINTLGQRGYPLMASALDWVQAHREFMADRSALNRARSTFAYRATVKGGQSTVNKVASAFERPSPLNPSEGARHSRAGVFASNEGIDLDTISMPTDGASAQNDQRSLRSLASLPGGIPDFLLGDTGASNLATATATQRPMETMLSGYQGMWAEYIEDMCFHLARWVNWTGSPEVIIDPPDILAKQPWEVARGYAELVKAVPAVGAAPQIIQMILTDAGVKDVESAMAIIEPLLGMPHPDAPDVEDALEALREAARAAS